MESRRGWRGSPKPEKDEIEKIRLAISSNAYRDAAVSVANYVATTANTLLCAAFAGLAESFVFSVTLQLVNACVNVSAVMLTTYQPSLQSAYANRDIELERDLSGKSMASFAPPFFMWHALSLSFSLVCRSSASSSPA